MTLQKCLNVCSKNIENAEKEQTYVTQEINLSPPFFSSLKSLCDFFYVMKNALPPACLSKRLNLKGNVIIIHELTEQIIKYKVKNRIL